MNHPGSCNALCQFVLGSAILQVQLPVLPILKFEASETMSSVAAGCAYTLVSIDPQSVGNPFHNHQSIFRRSFIQRQH